jgi:hypothetical protein
MSVLAPTTADTTVIARCPLPKRWRITVPSRQLRRKRSDNSTKGEDFRRRHNNDGMTGRGWGDSNKDNKEAEYNGCWRMTGKVASAPAKRRGGAIVLCFAPPPSPAVEPTSLLFCQAALRCSDW